MNKFFAKLAGALSLVALVAGAGVAVASGVNAKGVSANEGSVSKSSSTLREENGWTASAGSDIGTKFSSFALDSYITVSFEGTGNTATYWTSGTNIRVYGTKGKSDASITFTGGSNVTIKTITLTYALSNSPTFSPSITSGTALNVNANSQKITMTSGSSNGQIKITNFAATYTYEGETTQYNVSGSITNGALQENGSKVDEDSTFVGHINPTSGYWYPTSVSATMGGDPVSPTYDSETGVLTIPNVSGDIAVTATCPALPSPEHAGTESDPYTVEDAFRAINLGTGLTNVYATGKISKIVTPWSTEHKNISFNISADGTQSGKQLEAYRCDSSTQHPISGDSDVEVGATVVIYGTLKKYNSTYEFDDGCIITSYDISKELTSITLSGTQPTEFEVGDTFSYEGLIVTAHYDNGSSTVVTPTSVSTPDMTSIGEKTVTVSYTEDEVTKDAEYVIEVTAVSTKWTISFDPGEGSGEMASVQVKDGDDYTLPACTFTAPSGKVFDYWDVYGEPKEIIENVDDDYEVVAKWKDGPSEVADVLNNANTIKETTTSYSSWTTDAMPSGAVYAGQSAGGNGTIQLRTNSSNSGIVSTTSGGKICRVDVVWGSSTSDERVLDVWGSNTAYTNPTELYNATFGTKVGSIAKLSETSLEIEGDYAYVGVRSNSGALYLESITFTWDSDAPTPEPRVLSSISISNEKTEYEVGDSFVMPTVTAHYDDESTADVSSKATQSGFDSSAAVTGQEVTISYTESEVTKEASFFVNITEPAPVETKTYKKVETNLADFSGDYLIVYEEGLVAFDGSLTTLDAAANNVSVSITNDLIELSENYEFHIAAKEGGYSIQSSSGYYIGRTADSNGLNSDTTDKYTNSISFVSGEISVVGQAAGGPHLRFNKTSGQNRFRFFASGSYTGQQPIALYQEVADSGEALMLDLLNTTSTACAAEGEHSKADFETAWSALKTAYNAISDETVLNKLATTDGNAKGTMFYEALARYDLLVGKYGLDNFISGRVVSSLGNTSVISNGSVDSNSAMIIITVIALTSISSIAVLLVIKRRKAIR